VRSRRETFEVGKVVCFDSRTTYLLRLI